MTRSSPVRDLTENKTRVYDKYQLIVIARLSYETPCSVSNTNSESSGAETRYNARFRS